MNRRVTVLIDNYNYARFLRQAIDSALAQTYPDVEVVVVDDGSTDASREIILSYGDRIRRVLKENGGQASAFNAGFAAARGEIVMLLDADDYLAPNATARIVATWSEDTRIVQHLPHKVDAEGRDLGIYATKLSAGNVVPLILRHGSYGVAPTSGLAYHRDLLQKILPIPEESFRICADAYLFLSAPFLAPVIFAGEGLACYRVHGGNAFHEEGPRRNRRRRALEISEWHAAAKKELILALASKHGFPAPDPTTWENSGAHFDHLLLLRSSPNGKKRAEMARTVVALLRKLRTESSPLAQRARLAAVAILVWLAPIPLLRRVYPNIFTA
jgi:glycosyltransferase involved in cell wall biosynthesis